MGRPPEAESRRRGGASAASPIEAEGGGRGLHRFACLTAAATFALIVAGGLVTSTESGLAVPDWPLSYGGFFPPMVGGVRFEHGHRMVAGAVAILMTILAVWLQARERRAWVRKLGWAALAAVLAQAVLGGITVLFLLPPAVSVAHACLAQTFFCLTVTLAIVTSMGWRTAERVTDPSAGFSSLSLGILTTAVVFGQLALGALMRHTGSGLAIPDFPLSLGRWAPPLDSPGVAINFTHRLGAVAVAACAAWTVCSVARNARAREAVGRPAAFLAGLVLLQWLLGALTVWSVKAVIPTTAHVANGALVLATSLALTLGAGRKLAPVRPALPAVVRAS